MITTQHKVEDFLRGFGLGSEEARMASLGIMATIQPDLDAHHDSSTTVHAERGYAPCTS